MNESLKHVLAIHAEFFNELHSEAEDREVAAAILTLAHITQREHSLDRELAADVEHRQAQEKANMIALLIRTMTEVMK